jgi:3'(2'), 5'-bisphosphate nucleotidase
VIQKADESPVTEADRRGEKLILEHLAEIFPDIPVISEEDASEFGTPDAIGPRFFLVDPLDGTKAFVRGDPHFTVNIGLIDHGVPVAGAICAPPSGECWYTVDGGVMKRTRGGVEASVKVRPWPKGEAVALVSHTMKEETRQKLAAEYGFDRREPMDSSIKLCRIAEGARRHLSAPRADHGVGHGRGPGGAGGRGRLHPHAGGRALRLRQGAGRLPERLVRGAREIRSSP